MADPNELSAAEAARAIADGKLTSEALIEASLARIAAREDKVKAWAHLDPGKALAQARARDREDSRGPLHGVPVGVKDIIDTADMPTSYNSAIYKDYRPKIDAACVVQTRLAGGVVMGKTVTTEFAIRHPGPTRNPHDPGHTQGGSSSGSAAGVADFMIPLGYATQTGGSTVRPAAYCGTVGYKPTYNTINRAGTRFVSESLDTIGVLARTVEDAALLTHAVAGQAMPDFAAKPEGTPRIGFCRTSRWDKADEATRKHLEDAAGRLARAGAEVRDTELPAEADAFFDKHYAMMTFEAAIALSYEYTHHKDLLGTDTVEDLEAGLGVSHETYRERQLLAIAARQSADAFFNDFDVLLTPSAPGEALETLKDTGSSLFNRVWTVLYVPCVTLPVFTGAKGLPIGAQVVGRRYDDVRTLALANWVHQVLS